GEHGAGGGAVAARRSRRVVRVPRVHARSSGDEIRRARAVGVGAPVATSARSPRATKSPPPGGCLSAGRAGGSDGPAGSLSAGHVDHSLESTQREARSADGGRELARG